MKYFLLPSLAILFVSQLSIGAMIPNNDFTSCMPLVGLDDAAIDRMSATFLSLPNANEENIGIMTNVFKRINKNNTSAETLDCGIELLYLAITGGNSTLTLAKWKKIIHDIIGDKESNKITSSSSEENSSSSSSSPSPSSSSSSSSSSSEEASSSSVERSSLLEEVSAEDLEEIGEKLSRKLTAEQTRRVMVILNGLRNDATPAEIDTAMHDFLVSVISSLGLEPEQVKRCSRAFRATNQVRAQRTQQGWRKIHAKRDSLTCFMTACTLF